MSSSSKWTTDIPTQPGWYWWRFNDDKSTAQIVHVYRDWKTQEISMNGHSLWQLDIVGQWQGPLRPEE